MLEALDKKNQHTARDYLEMGREIARKMKNVFEEMQILNSLIIWAGQKGKPVEAAQWKKDLEGLMNIMKK